MHREAARRVKLQNENWNREQNLNGKRINSGCVTESVTAPGLLFQPRGGPGTELSRILTMYLQRRMPLSELSPGNSESAGGKGPRAAPWQQMKKECRI